MGKGVWWWCLDGGGRVCEGLLGSLVVGWRWNGVRVRVVVELVWDGVLRGWRFEGMVF